MKWRSPLGVMNASRRKRWIARALAAEQDHDFARAADAWGRAYKVDPGYLQAGIRYAINARKAHGTERLDDFLHRMVRQFPDHPAPHRELGKNYLRTDRALARDHWARAFELDPTHEGTGLVLARLCLDLGEAEAGLDAVRQLLPSCRVSEKFANVACRTFAQTQRWDELERFCREGIEQSPEWDCFHRGLGQCVLTRIRMLIKEWDPDCRPLPISLEARGDFLRDPSGALRAWIQHPLHDSLESYRRQSAARKASNRPAATCERLKVLFVTESNWNFARGVIESLHSDPQFEVRTLELDDLPEEENPRPEVLIGMMVTAGEKSRPVVPLGHPDSYYRKLLDWADVIFAEWAFRAALWTSLFASPQKRLIVRMHSFEAFTAIAHVINWGNVDALIHVADPIREFFRAQIDVTEYGSTEIHTIPNYNDLTKFDRKKEQQARRTLGMICYDTANKNPRFALELLHHLRTKTAQWRLLLVGHPWSDDPDTDSERLYANQFHQDLVEFGLQDVVEFVPFTDRLEEVITRIGYIVSGSDREGTHEVVLQSMGGGTIPVVRNWPLMQAWGGAARLYDPLWICDTPAEAAEKIRRIDREGQHDLYCERARREAFQRYDQSVVMPQIRSVIQGIM